MRRRVEIDCEFMGLYRICSALVIIALFILSGCDRPGPDGPIVDETSVLEGSETQEVVAPIRIAVFQDKSGSVSWTKTPTLRAEEDFEPLFARLRVAGGELAFGLIADNSNRGLLRVRVQAPPLPPLRPTGNVFLVSRQMEAFRHNEKIYRELHDAWVTETDQRVGTFSKELKSLLANPKLSRHSDVWGAVQRADLFLAEPDSASVQTSRIMILISDGIHNTTHPSVSVKSNAEFILVNGAASIGTLAGMRARQFESVESAFRYVAEKGGSE